MTDQLFLNSIIFNSFLRSFRNLIVRPSWVFIFLSYFVTIKNSIKYL